MGAGGVGNQGYVGGTTLRNTVEPKWALLRLAHIQVFIITLVLLNHYFSENDSVGLNFSMFSIQLKAPFSSCAL